MCTTRAYTFDNNTNRTGQTTIAAPPGASCTIAGETTVTRVYDTGYTYDAFGRTTA
ncbi:hypothetical protein LO772_07890 [Yinghuangia sp. ASG 101]|uniref:hypothetical protein n=1 Tax=Yinghuangia sp. ASG 101 TaxID=2896848 RepID=UPI001E3B27B8|nr:hypothetical protein [Yinghuangia sp. ASG 101]UGQ13515.1 hypothetical protein LO772_07890 [Yinghuangia sp. ASG 101]